MDKFKLSLKKKKIRKIKTKRNKVALHFRKNNNNDYKRLYKSEINKPKRYLFIIMIMFLFFVIILGTIKIINLRHNLQFILTFKSEFKNKILNNEFYEKAKLKHPIFLSKGEAIINGKKYLDICSKGLADNRTYIKSENPIISAVIPAHNC
jgi:hypothetical protein